MSKAEDGVILLHGIARTDRVMRRLEQALIYAGYDVLNVNYPSRKHDIFALADWLKDECKDFINRSGAVHFIGYSMGGLLIRAFLQRHRPKNLGRVVMAGTPNHGSEVADFFRRNPIFKWFYGPAGQQLGTDFDVDKAFGVVDYPVGIIAGNFSIDPITSWFMIKGEDDGMVSVASTHVTGEADHIVLPVCHMFMMQDTQLIESAVSFLRRGKFS
jgi:pimeloyl-ACP methyl ester carboxylesterase